MKGFIKWLGKINVFIYAAIMFFGTIITTIVSTELGAGVVPIFIFDGIMVVLYLLGFVGSKFIKD